jgi:Fuc2NAc and GlcNAc transferase
MTQAALIFVAALMSALLTGWMRRYALHAKLLDRPNERSSHAVPTPRGGGVAIVTTFLLALVGLTLVDAASVRLCTAVWGAGLTVAALGFVDDRGHVSARWRLAGHIAAAVWALGWIGALPALPMLGVAIDFGPFIYPLAVVFLVWWINLFNFMDGIDGIASVQAMGMGLGGALVWWLSQPVGDWFAAVLFAACVAGFLVWNFPPARIFMGDAGSGFLGLVVALFALWSARQTPQLFFSWLILGGCFMVDATTTLVRRVRRGDRFYEAHRSHAYQYAARIHGSHKLVTLAVLAINTLWLLPIAVAVAMHWVDGFLGMALAFAPLAWLAFRYKAGDQKAQLDRRLPWPEPP